MILSVDLLLSCLVNILCASLCKLIGSICHELARQTTDAVFVLGHSPGISRLCFTKAALLWPALAE